MTATSSPRVRIFCTDLDGTILGHPESASRFLAAWEAIPRGSRPLLIYNTSRTVEETHALVRAQVLAEPDYIIGNLGTQLYTALYNLSDDFIRQFGRKWNAARIEGIVAGFAGPRRQSSGSIEPFRSSWFWERARSEDLAAVEARLREAGMEAQVGYSCRYFLDVLPARAGKGNALAWLARRLGVSLDQVVVAGDSVRDASMFLLAGVRAILVENALPELRKAVADREVFSASSPLADGVLEGLIHFGVLGVRAG